MIKVTYTTPDGVEFASEFDAQQHLYILRDKASAKADQLEKSSYIADLKKEYGDRTMIWKVVCGLYGEGPCAYFTGSLRNTLERISLSEDFDGASIDVIEPEYVGA